MAARCSAHFRIYHDATATAATPSMIPIAIPALAPEDIPPEDIPPLPELLEGESDAKGSIGGSEVSAGFPP